MFEFMSPYGALGFLGRLTTNMTLPRSFEFPASHTARWLMKLLLFGHDFLEAAETQRQRGQAQQVQHG